MLPTIPAWRFLVRIGNADEVEMVSTGLTASAAERRLVADIVSTCRWQGGFVLRLHPDQQTRRSA